jgi:hypothetical protein
MQQPKPKDKEQAPKEPQVSEFVGLAMADRAEVVVDKDCLKEPCSCNGVRVALRRPALEELLVDMFGEAAYFAILSGAYRQHLHWRNIASLQQAGLGVTCVCFRMGEWLAAAGGCCSAQPLYWHCVLK